MGGVKSKHSERQVLEEKQRYMRMTLAERRSIYCVYKEVDSIPVWSDHYRDTILPRGGNDLNHLSKCTVRDDINRRVSLYHGDITELEVDAIVNSASKGQNPMRDGLVNTAIVQKAGQYFLDECINEGIYPSGSARLVGGYQLPAKNVINVFVPRGKDEADLRSCYKNALKIAEENRFKTLALPCLGTRKKINFSWTHAAQIALSTVREWMNSNFKRIDRLIFCVHEVDSLVHYNWYMQEYFPVDATSSSTTSQSATQPSHQTAAATATAPSVPGGQTTPSTSTTSTTAAAAVVPNSMDATRRLILEEKERYMKMSLTEKRQQYKVGQYVELSQITRWPAYYSRCNTRAIQSPYQERDDLNSRVAIWKGDICRLELDAIINSTGGPSGGGGVNMAVISNAGNTYKEECGLNGYAKPGEAMLSGGYRLPAKYVINVCPPQFEQDNILSNCYSRCLDIVNHLKLKAVAFPCIATQKNFSFTPEKAARLALDCVRGWLESHGSEVDLIVFCVYHTSDLEIYQNQMQYYFPVQSAT